MFLFTTLLITLLTIGVMFGLAAAIGGTAMLLVFGDLVVFGMFIGFIVKRFITKN